MDAMGVPANFTAVLVHDGWSLPRERRLADGGKCNLDCVPVHPTAQSSNLVTLRHMESSVKKGFHVNFMRMLTVLS